MHKVCLFVLFAWLLPAWAHDEDEPVTTSAELRNWCREQSERQLRRQDLEPYNWTSSWWERDGILYTEGEWRTRGDRISVVCRARKGSRRKTISYGA